MLFKISLVFVILCDNQAAGIVHGMRANWSNIKYQVSLRLWRQDRPFGAGHICGGVWIGRSIVLTAAHCTLNAERTGFREPDEFLVVAGSPYRTTKENHTLFFCLERIVRKGTFDALTLKDDIAVLHLRGNVPDGYAHAHPIELNTQRHIAGGSICEISGWGATERVYASAYLISATVAIIDRIDCKNSYEDELQDGMLCAGYLDGRRDSCIGDSGGPLVCNSTLVGIISAGNKCASPGYPGVYADVAFYAEWIAAEMVESSASLSYHCHLSENITLENYTTPPSAAAHINCNGRLMLLLYFCIRIL